MQRALLLGDALVILSFALGGVFFHHLSGNALWQGLRIAAPFLFFYLPLAALFQRWGAKGTLLAWLLGMHLGFAWRGLTSPTFRQIALLWTGIGLVLWRLLLRRWR